MLLPMRLLVLGGTWHVGRAVVGAGLERGAEVTVLNRGLSRPAPQGVRVLHADRRPTRRAVCRPVHDTGADTRQWMQVEGYPAAREGRPTLGFDREREHAPLVALGRAG